ncbi:unnamed protein product [Phaeothamnion confervicola]
MDVTRAVSILISSEFLRMDRLVAECLAFVAANLGEIVKLPIDLACLNDAMVVRLARLATLEQLARARDRRDKLLSRVFKKRIELDFRDRSVSNTVLCCRYCRRLYPESAAATLSCAAAPPVIDFRGAIVRRHDRLRPWSLTQLVTSLHRRGMSWTQVYWLLWGLTKPLRCVRCSQVFPAGDIGCCRHGPEMVVVATAAAAAASGPKGGEFCSGEGSGHSAARAVAKPEGLPFQA